VAGEQDFEAVNRMALEQINKLEKADNKGETIVSPPPPYSFNSGGNRVNDYWGRDYARPSWRPNSQGETTSSTRVPLFGGTVSQRSYYTSRDVGGSYNNPDAFYRKTLNAVYRHETPKKENTESKGSNVKEQEMMVSTINVSTRSLGGSLFSDFYSQEEQGVLGNQESQEGQVYYAVKPPAIRVPKISQDTKNQMAAIVLSGFSRVASTMILNWAKEKRVPYELL
jgi:hypothetical protein